MGTNTEESEEQTDAEFTVLLSYKLFENRIPKRISTP
ncbi:hypothetical protein IK1_06050 [Bacillus cereus VD146]|uniref:Uncharacterized protein n=1 Tax=Bacillus cereus (strain VD146) TaxID=1053236 RepID=R8NJC8_BACCX|nr:hypothetical protein IK1_06050 [Bacillus cereus VD146]